MSRQGGTPSDRKDANPGPIIVAIQQEQLFKQLHQERAMEWSATARMFAAARFPCWAALLQRQSENLAQPCFTTPDFADTLLGISPANVVRVVQICDEVGGIGRFSAAACLSAMCEQQSCRRIVSLYRPQPCSP
jgi:hypothetical protein